MAQSPAFGAPASGEQYILTAPGVERIVPDPNAEEPLLTPGDAGVVAEATGNGAPAATAGAAALSPLPLALAALALGIGAFALGRRMRSS